MPREKGAEKKPGKCRFPVAVERAILDNGTRSWRVHLAEVDPIMKRFLAAAAFLLVGGGTASADYVLLKINLNQLNPLPAAGMAGAGANGRRGGGVPGMPPGPAECPSQAAAKAAPAECLSPACLNPAAPEGGAGMVGGAAAPAPIDAANLFPDDPDARYITALVEMNNFKFAGKTAYGTLLSAETHYSPGKASVSRSPSNSLSSAPNASLPIPSSTNSTSSSPRKKKDKNIETMLNLARWTLPCRLSQEIPRRDG